MTVSTAPAPRPGARFKKSHRQRRTSEVNGQRSLLLLPDRHYPHQDRRCEAVVDDIISTLAPTEIGILGDWIDCGRFSKHPAKSVAEQAQDFLECEIKPAVAKLKQLKGNGARLWYVAGNHEHRVESFFTQHGLVDILPLVSPQVLLGAYVDEWIPYVPAGHDTMPHKRIADDAIAIHSWTHAKQAADVNLALAKPLSVFFGHTHRPQLAWARHPVLGVECMGVCAGTNSEIQPRYGHGNPSGWGQGVTWLRFHGTDWTAYNIAIRGGACVLPDGRRIAA